MTEERGLLGIINCLGTYHEKTVSFYDLIVLGLVSIIIISLLFYYNKLSRKKIIKNGEEYIDIKKNRSSLANSIVSILILFFVTSSFQKIIEYSDVLILVSLPLSIFYLNNIHNGITVKRVLKKLKVDTPIYNQSKDILLQEKSVGGVYLTQEKTLSIWAKLTIYLLVIMAITTPLYQLFGIGHFI